MASPRPRLPWVIFWQTDVGLDVRPAGNVLREGGRGLHKGQWQKAEQPDLQHIDANAVQHFSIRQELWKSAWSHCRRRQCRCRRWRRWRHLSVKLLRSHDILSFLICKIDGCNKDWHVTAFFPPIWNQNWWQTLLNSIKPIIFDFPCCHLIQNH